MRRALVLTACAVGSAAAGPRPGWHSSGAEPAVITFIASEYAFQGPSEVPAGLVTILMVNGGAEIHWMEMYRLAHGRTLGDFLRVLEDTRLTGPLPGWLTAAGGPGWIGPGDSSNATFELEPGRYALICRFPTPEGIPHSAKGMVRQLRVAPSRGPAGAEPREDAVLTISDSAFQLSAPLRAGRRTVRVENVGLYRHEVYVFRLAPGKTIEDYWAWERTGLKGAGPGRPLGGVTPFEPGQRFWFVATFDPQEYVLGDESGHGPDIFRQVAVR